MSRKAHLRDATSVGLRESEELDLDICNLCGGHGDALQYKDFGKNILSKGESSNLGSCSFHCACETPSGNVQWAG